MYDKKMAILDLHRIHQYLGLSLSDSGLLFFGRNMSVDMEKSETTAMDAKDRLGSGDILSKTSKKAESIVVVNNLKKKYGNRYAVKGVSFEVKKGEIFGILGPNGAGKTTTLEMIETLRSIDEGQALVDDIDVAKSPQQVKYIIGVQPQSPAFMDKVKLTEQLEQMASTYGQKVSAKRLLKEVDLTDKANAYVESLSGGQKQRFSIVASLVHKPKVFFMDEPTTGLDPQARRNLWELVQDINKKGTTVILTTHYMDEAELLCDRVAIMDKGKIITIDTPKNLIKQLLARGFKKSQHVEQANLEDVFIDLTGKGLRD